MKYDRYPDEQPLQYVTEPPSDPRSGFKDNTDFMVHRVNDGPRYDAEGSGNED